jgi:hypothetical protein
MSVPGKLVSYVSSEVGMALWRARFDSRVGVRPEKDASNPADVSYIGVMSSDYAQMPENRLFVPVDSGAELFALVPDRYEYIGSQLAVKHRTAGKLAIPLDWSEYHCVITDPTYGMIRLLVAFLLTQIKDEGFAHSLQESNDTTVLVRHNFTPQVVGKSDELYELLCGWFGEIHTCYYGEYPGKYTERIPELVARNQALVDVLYPLCSLQGQRALGILQQLGGQWSREWVAGLRELGHQALLAKDGMFAGENLIAWLEAIQAEFEFSVRKVVASHVWVQEQRRREIEDNDGA